MVCSLALVLSVFRMVVIPVQFEDVSFSCGTDVLAAKVAEAERYFCDQPAGYDGFEFDLAPIVTLGKEVSYYGANYSDRRDALLHEAVRQACTASRNAVDFSSYDNDGDSEVDNIFILFAGPSESDGAGAEYIWPQHGTLRENGGVLAIGGVQINSFSVCTELSTDDGANPRQAGIGTFCHEFGHYLGLPDFYDSDGEGSGGISSGLWGTGLMDKGCMAEDGVSPPNFSALDLDILGTGDCRQLAPGNTVLQPINASRTYLKLPNPDDEREYFLLECRRDVGWDSLIGGSGLVIYHVDKSMNSAGHSESYGRTFTASQRWVYNEINCNPAHQCAYIVKAYPNAGDVSQIFFPYEDRNSFTAYTTPAFTFWSGKSSYLAITNIHRDGDNIVFTVSRDTGRPSYATEINAEYYQDAAIISWSASDGVSGKAYVSIEGKGIEPEEKEVDAYESGKFSVTYEGLTPSTAYTVSIYFKKDELKGETEEIKFTTSAKRAMNYPFIYLKYVARNDDGSFPAGTKFPLRLFNATDADGIVWKYDGEEISTGKNGYFTPEKSGVMTAEIYYGDGSKDIVSKEIELK